MSTREKLIQTAKDLLWERGYEGMSPAAVQERSGAGQGSFYHHFRGKLALASTALTEVQASMLSDFEVLLGESTPIAEAIRLYLEAPRDGTRGCRMGRHAGERAIGEPALRGPVAGYFEILEQRWVERLTRASEQGDLPPEMEPAALASSLVAIVQGGYVLARVHDDPERMTQALRGMLQLFNRIFGVP